MSDFDRIQPYAEWPAIQVGVTDTRTSTFVPDLSVDSSKIRELSVIRLQGIGAKVYQAGAQTIDASGSEETIAFDTTSFTEGFDALASGLLTIPRTGIYMLSTNLEWASATGETFAWFYINGSKKEGDSRSDNTGIVTRIALTTVRSMTAGDTVGVRVKQTNGAATRDINGGEANCSLTIAMLFAI